jgi:hypothetical protein
VDMKLSFGQSSYEVSKFHPTRVADSQPAAFSPPLTKSGEVPRYDAEGALQTLLIAVRLRERGCELVLASPFQGGQQRDVVPMQGDQRCAELTPVPTVN